MEKVSDHGTIGPRKYFESQKEKRNYNLYRKVPKGMNKLKKERSANQSATINILNSYKATGI